jgi:hypothetical protein
MALPVRCGYGAAPAAITVAVGCGPFPLDTNSFMTRAISSVNLNYRGAVNAALDRSLREFENFSSSARIRHIA